MKNKETIKYVYDEIHAPDMLFGKVMEMDKKESKMRYVFKYVVGAAAALAITFVTSNGVCYATTGETWVSKAIVYINGEKTEQEVTWHESGDLVYGEIEVPVEDGEEVQVRMFDVLLEDEVEMPDKLVIMTEDDFASDGVSDGVYTEDAFVAELVQEDGKVFLVTAKERIDVTEDLSDGEATGTFKFSGLTVKYTITGSAEEYEIEIVCE